MITLFCYTLAIYKSNPKDIFFNKNPHPKKIHSLDLLYIIIFGVAVYCE